MTLDRTSLVASVLIHVATLVVLLVAPISRDDVLYEVVNIQIYSPPPAPAPPEEETAPPEPEDELIVETPEPEPPAEEPEPEPEAAPVEPEPEPEPPPEEAAPEDPPVQETPVDEPPADPPPPTTEPPPEEAEAAAETESREDAEEGGLDIDVRQEAFSRDYPDYYGNIVVQMRRCFRPPSQTREATVSFVVRRDGTTGEIDVARSSSSFVFDLAAQEAAECAGKSGRLGPLPDDYPLEVLPILFSFSPKRR